MSDPAPDDIAGLVEWFDGAAQAYGYVIDAGTGWDGCIEHAEHAAAKRALLRALSALSGENKRLREALAPFAGYLNRAAFDLDNNGNPLPDEQGMGWIYLNVGHFRAARAALNSTEPTDG